MAGADGYPFHRPSWCWVSNPMMDGGLVLDGVEEEVVASDRPSSRIRVSASTPMRLVPERGPVRPGRLVHPATVPASAAAVQSEYDRMERTKQMAATWNGTNPSPMLSDSLMGQLREVGHMPMMEFYAEGYRQAGASGGYYHPSITEAVLGFSLTQLWEDAEWTVNAADVMRAKWTDSEAEVADRRARLQAVGAHGVGLA
jgi:hypothetical protein